MSVKDVFFLLYNLLERFGNLDFCWLYSRIRAVFDKPGENEFWSMNKIKDFWWLLKMVSSFILTRLQWVLLYHKKLKLVKKDKIKFLGDKKCEQPTDIKVRFATPQSVVCGSCYIN